MEKKCHICKKTIKRCDGNHIYRCDGLKDKKEIRYRYISFNFPHISKKENLHKNYVENLKSLPMLKEEYNIDYMSVKFLLNYFNIKVRTISESSKLISVEKSKKTNLKRYGVENPSKLDSVKEKKKETFKKNYGVDNIWKSDDYREWLNSHMIEKYGVKSVSNINGNADYWGWNKLNDSEKSNRIEILHSNFTSGLEMRVKSLISELGVDFKHQYYIDGNSYDFLINGNVIVEVNGDYWHANPSIFKHNDWFFFRNGMTAKEIWDKDSKKIQKVLKKGYNVLVLWESDIKSMSDDDIIKIISNKIWC